MASVAEVDLVISTEDTLSDLERDLERIIRTAENGAPELDVEATLDIQESLGNLRQELTRVIRAAEESGDEIQIEAALDRDRSLADIQESLRNVVRAAELGNDVTIALQAEAPVLASLGQVQRDVRAIVEAAEASAPDIEIEVEVDRDRRGAAAFASLGRAALGALPSVGKLSGGIVAVGVAAGSAAPLIAGLVGAVESILPATALAASGIVTLGLVVGTTKLAFQGVGDAVKNAFDPDVKPEDFAKSMENLAPNARAFVTELRGMRGALKELRLDVQERFFEGFDHAVSNLADTALPKVSKALRDTAGSLNRMALGAADAAVQLAQDGTLGRALTGSTDALGRLVNIPGQFVTGLGQIAAAAAPAFNRVTQAAADGATRIAEKLNAAFESGRLEEAINKSIDALAQLGRVFGNVFGGIGNVISGFTAQGAGLFTTLEKITQAFEDVTASEGFQQALRALAETFGVLVDNVLPLITTALQALGPVFQALAAPLQILIRALGDGLTRVVTALSPVLTAAGNAFGQLVIAVTPLIDLAADLLVAVLPGLIPVFDAVGQSLNALVPFVEALATSLSTALVPLFTTIATEVLPALLPPFVELSTRIIPVLTEVIIGLTPTLITLAETFGELVVALTPLIVELINMGLVIADELAPILGPLLGLIINLVNLGFKFLADTVTGIIIPLINILVSLLKGDFSGAWSQAGDLVAAIGRKIDQAIQFMYDKVMETLRNMVNQVPERVREMAAGALRAFEKWVSDSVQRARDLPQKVKDGIGDLGNLLTSAGRDIVQGLIKGMTDKLGELRAIASKVASTVSGSVKGFLGIESPSKLMREVGNDTMDGFRLGLADQVPELRSQLQSVAALAPSFALPNGQSLQLPQTNTQGPVVQVFIGNEQLNGHFDARIARNNQARDRLALTGVRR